MRPEPVTDSPGNAQGHRLDAQLVGRVPTVKVSRTDSKLLVFNEPGNHRARTHGVTYVILRIPFEFRSGWVMNQSLFSRSVKPYYRRVKFGSRRTLDIKRGIFLLLLDNLCVRILI